MADNDLTDEQVLELWSWAAEAAADHRPSVCGHEDGRCKYRRLNLEECDALADEWLARHGRPTEPVALPSVRQPATGSVAG